MQTFEKSEVEGELSERLEAAGIDPNDETAKKITAVVSAYYAERTAQVLAKVRDLLDKVQPDELH